MTTQELLNRYESEIKSIALFAKRINYNLNEDITELVRLWINDTKKIYSDENKEQVLSILKSILK